jgi:hypothetical protein
MCQEIINKHMNGDIDITNKFKFKKLIKELYCSGS